MFVFFFSLQNLNEKIAIYKYYGQKKWVGKHAKSKAILLKSSSVCDVEQVESVLTTSCTASALSVLSLNCRGSRALHFQERPLHVAGLKTAIFSGQQKSSLRPHKWIPIVTSVCLWIHGTTRHLSSQEDNSTLSASNGRAFCGIDKEHKKSTILWSYLWKSSEFNIHVSIYH